MNKFEKIVKNTFVFSVFVGIILSFVILNGINHGFRLWNWLVIIACAVVYFAVFTVSFIKEIRNKKKVNKEELSVNDYYKEQAQDILQSMDEYLKANPKIADDLKVYWPIYISVLRRIAKGKKYSIGKTYGVFAQLSIWQQRNREDAFLSKIKDVLDNNVISNE